MWLPCLVTAISYPATVMLHCDWVDAAILTMRYCFSLRRSATIGANWHAEILRSLNWIDCATEEWVQDGAFISLSFLFFR